MIMKRILPLALLSGFSAMFFSCEMTVDVELPASDPVLVVNAQPESGTPLLVDVTLSQSVLSNDPGVFPPLTNARVLLIRNGSDSLYADYFDPLKLYAFPLIPAEGDFFELQVSHPGYPAVRAEARIPQALKIENVTLEHRVEKDRDGNELARLSFDISDRPDEADYFSLELKYLGTDSIVNSACFQSDEPVFFRQGELQEPGDRSWFCEEFYFDDSYMTEHPYRVTVYLMESEFQLARELILRLKTHEAASYLYRTSLEDQLAVYGNPFAEPVIVYSNIENGLGIFAGSAASESRIPW